MEDFRTVRYIAIMAIILALFIGPTHSWDNYKAHPEINKLAYNKFVNEWMPKDENLKLASLQDTESEGVAWDLDMGGIVDFTSLPAINYKSEDKKKTIERWIIMGGFSADEPEAAQALRHFYDPDREPHYLTDFVDDWVSKYNPQISARDWAFGNTQNPYSFPKARQYFKEAVSMSDSPGNIMYGKAWRAVGETMHLVSDMTVPAHVRNDCHIPFSEHTRDPFEFYTTDVQVDLYSSGKPSPSINYKRTYPDQGDLSSLMDDVARWTNNHFFSADTVPIEGETKSQNGKSTYLLPAMDWGAKSKGYYYGKVDVQEIPLAKISLKNYLVTSSTQLEIDPTVWHAYSELLIPTAIEASVAVLDAFLPRFDVKIDSITKDSSDNTQYIVKGGLNLIKTNVWSDPRELIVRNGATLKIKSKKTGEETAWTLRCPENGDLNKITWKGQMDAGDEVTLEYNLGGYVIKSKPHKMETASSSGENKDNSYWAEKGHREYEAGEYEESLNSYEEALKIDPEDAICWTNKGLDLWLLGRYDDAIQAYEKSLEIEPSDPWGTWNDKGLALIDKGRALKDKGEIDLAKGAIDLAIQAFNKAIEIHSQDDSAWGNLGSAWNEKASALYSQGRDKEAEEANAKFMEAAEKATNLRNTAIA